MVGNERNEGPELEPCCHHQRLPRITRRVFLEGVGGTAMMGGIVGGIMFLPVTRAQETTPDVKDLAKGSSLRVKPVLVYALARRAEKTSWRPYGGLKTPEDVEAEKKRIGTELGELKSKAEFPMEVLPLVTVASDAEAAAVAGVRDCDVFLVYGAGGAQGWIEALAATKVPNILFVRHRSGPTYLWYEIAHWRLLRKSEDTFKEPNMDVHDVVVDDYGDVLWRLRALFGLKNAKGTKMVAIGGLAAYSRPGQERGPAHAKEVWGYDITTVPDADLKAMLDRAKADAALMRTMEKLAADFLAQPGVTLETERRFVINTFLAVHIFKQIMVAAGATNLGVATCMGSLIGLLDTAPCLALSILNDDGLTAFCHTDLTHTMPGVLLRWISGKPSFVSNSHFPHHGMVTLAHCAAPRRMDGKNFEPTKIMTHFESDYGAATKVEYTKGQVTTNIIPNLSLTKWYAFRGKILDSPAFDMCRSQIDMEIDGDWRRLLEHMEGFHTVTCYGDYLREVGYALRKVGIPWECVSQVG